MCEEPSGQDCGEVADGGKTQDTAFGSSIVPESDPARQTFGQRTRHLGTPKVGF